MSRKAARRRGGLSTTSVAASLSGTRGSTLGWPAGLHPGVEGPYMRRARKVLHLQAGLEQEIQKVAARLTVGLPWRGVKRPCGGNALKADHRES